MHSIRREGRGFKEEHRVYGIDAKLVAHDSVYKYVISTICRGLLVHAEC